MFVILLDPKPRAMAEVIACPQLWPRPPGWPFLLLMKKEEDGKIINGLMIDLFRQHGITGYSSTVFISNPRTNPDETDINKIIESADKEVYDTPEEVVQAGWVLLDSN